MKGQVIGGVIVFSLAIIAFKVLRPSSGFDSRVQTRLEQSGYGKVRNIRELNTAMKGVPLTRERFEALMCIPHDKFRSGIMQSFVQEVSPNILTEIRNGKDSIVHKFFVERYGYSNEFVGEFIRSARDSTYTPKQTF